MPGGALRAESERRPVIWISAENVGVVEALGAAGPELPTHDMLGVVLYDGGASEAHPLAHVHGHGNWINRLADS